ncbi:hypothetical protein MP228_010086 [Amoeboaphelidium protococcarum]|nr:hypothetical protein MP228_010086 [Amoeboaphelidium protococcarum]
MDEFDQIAGQLQSEITAASTDKEFQGLCAQCNQVIKTSEVTLKAQGKSYHQHHFCCAHCDKSIEAKSQYIIHPDTQKQYHSQCYSEVYARPCACCSLKITDGSMVSSQITKDGPSVSFHPACFTCGNRLKSSDGSGDNPTVKGCGVLLFKNGHSSKYRIDKDVILCIGCHDKHFTIVCFECNNKILPDSEGKVSSVVIKGKQYHSECFKCARCAQVFVEFKAYPLNDKFYCLKDYELVKQGK